MRDNNIDIFKPLGDNETLTDQTISHSDESAYYTMIGDHDFLDDSKNPLAKSDNDKVVAKKIVNTKTRYFVKSGPYGKLFNPIGLYSEGRGNRFIAKSGKNLWTFKEVNNKVFSLYVSFLKTKNTAWLTNAEREMA
jgi:hypothetical protein